MVVTWNQETDDIRDCIRTLEFCKIHLFPRYYFLRRNKTPILNGGSILILMLILRLKLILMVGIESKTARTCESYMMSGI